MKEGIISSGNIKMSATGKKYRIPKLYISVDIVWFSIILQIQMSRLVVEWHVSMKRILIMVNFNPLSGWPIYPATAIPAEEITISSNLEKISHKVMLLIILIPLEEVLANSPILDLSERNAPGLPPKELR